MRRTGAQRLVSSRALRVWQSLYDRDGDALESIGCSGAAVAPRRTCSRGHRRRQLGSLRGGLSADRSRCRCRESPTIIQAAASTGSRGYYYFQWDASSQCTYLYVSNASWFGPVQP
jgi:hypothetical protein